MFNASKGICYGMMHSDYETNPVFRKEVEELVQEKSESLEYKGFGPFHRDDPRAYNPPYRCESLSDYLGRLLMSVTIPEQLCDLVDAGIKPEQVVTFRGAKLTAVTVASMLSDKAYSLMLKLGCSHDSAVKYISQAPAFAYLHPRTVYTLRANAVRRIEKFGGTVPTDTSAAIKFEYEWRPVEPTLLITNWNDLTI